MDRYEFGKMRRQILKEFDKCEICGGKRNLEVHHIIPKVCENDSIDLDVEDNLIVLCGKCHAMLTPRNVLCKYGLSKVKENNKRLIKEYEIRHKTVGWRVEKFYEELQEFAEAGERLTYCDLLDVFDKWFIYDGKSNVSWLEDYLGEEI